MSYIAKSNDYWLPKERRLELEHFCKQYNGWKKAMACVDGMSKIPADVLERVQTLGHGDPVARAAETREYYSNRMDMVRRCCYEAADSTVACYIFKCVTEGLSYDKMSASAHIPCGRRQFYQAVNRFFWHLSSLRG